MRDTELKRKKAEALYSVYKRCLEEGHFASMREVARYASKQPAPRFFIEAKIASDLVGRISRKVSLINLNSNSRKQVWQLHGMYQKYLAEHPDCQLSRERIMEILVDEPAPEFYITTEGARRLLYGEIRKVRRRSGW